MPIFFLQGAAHVFGPPLALGHPLIHEKMITGTVISLTLHLPVYLLQ